jgi:hypothetical protein
MQGAYLNGARLPSKRAFKDAIQTTPDRVRLEATSFAGTEYDGTIDDAPAGKYYVVGPCPYTARKWYAQVVVTADKVVVK